MKEQEWPILCCAGHEFALLTEEQVWHAIERETGEEKPVMREIMRLGAKFLATFKLYVDQHGLSETSARFPVRSGIEKVAIEVLIRYLQAHRADVMREAPLLGTN